MPGLCTIASAPLISIDALLDEVLGAMAPYPWLKSARHVDNESRVALGVVTFEGAVANAVAVSDDGNLVAAVYGEFFDTERLTKRPPLEAARIFLEGWQREGDVFPAALNGEFAAAVFDRARAELHVVTDRFGLRPIYVSERADSFAAASEIKALLPTGADTSWSEAGVAEFFSFGHFYGGETFLRGVRAVAPATVVTWHARDHRVTERQYWNHPRPLTGQSAGALDDAFDERFVTAVRRRARPGERLGLSLSGGLDARAILGVMPAGVNLQTVSLGIDGSLDHRSAAELAAIAGVPHHPYLLDDTFLSSFETYLRQMVRLTDGHYLDQGIVMPTMEIYRRLGIEQLMRGHGGELLHMRKAYAFSLDDAALKASEPELESWLLSHLTDYMLGGVPDDLFTIDLRGGARSALRAAIARTPASVDRPVDRIWHLFMNERLHRETSMSMHLFGSFATIRQPYLDNDVIDVLFAMPASMKLGDSLQTSLLRRHRPAFLDVTNSNTGTKMGAGRLTTELSRFRLRVGAKLGWKGYQPYERLGLWLRRELRDLVVKTVTSERMLDTRLFRADAIKRIVNQHLEQQANHTFLIMSLLIFALGQETAETGSHPRRG
jgi:asparagine synthase (glutamine-hydrolysing)